MIWESFDGPLIRKPITDSNGKLVMYELEYVPGPRTKSQDSYHTEMESYRLKGIQESSEWNAAWAAASERTKAIHIHLDNFITMLSGAGVDVSYFPHRASMAQLEFANKLSKELL